MPVTKCFPVWICACVCLCVLVWPLLPVSLAGIRALAPRQRAPPRSAWHLRGPSGLGQHPGGSISSPRGGRRGGGSCSPGRHQRARVQRKTNPSALESMPTTHTHTMPPHGNNQLLSYNTISLVVLCMKVLLLEQLQF